VSLTRYETVTECCEHSVRILETSFLLTSWSLEEHVYRSLPQCMVLVRFRRLQDLLGQRQEFGILHMICKKFRFES